MFLPSPLHLLGLRCWEYVHYGWRFYPFAFTCFLQSVWCKVLFFRLLRCEVKGEGKNGKFAECACAYIRVGACPARSGERDFVSGAEVWDKTREEVAKNGEVLRESRLVFLSGVGEGEKNNFSCLLVLGLFRVVRLLFDFVHWLFRDGLLLFVLGFLILAPLSPFWYCSVYG